MEHILALPVVALCGLLLHSLLAAVRLLAPLLRRRLRRRRLCLGTNTSARRMVPATSRESDDLDLERDNNDEKCH